MHTTVAYSEIPGAVAAWGNIAAVPDAHKKTEGDYIYMDDFNKLIGFHCLGGTLIEQVRLSSPSIRRVNPYYITKFEQAILAAGVFELGAFWPDIALEMEIGEGLELEQFVSAAAEQLTHIVFLSESAPDPVRGNIHTVRFSTDIVRTAGTWSFAEIVLLDPLPVGSFDVVGARLEHATGIAFRLVPVGGIHRPGGICVKDFEDNDPFLQRYGGLGVWCSFEHGLVPGIELICSVAAIKAVAYGFLDIIPT